MRSRVFKTLAVVVALSVAGISGATYASSQDGGDKGREMAAGGVAPAAINPNLDLENKYVSVTPCRLLDTRAAGGKLNDVANGARAFDVYGTNLSAQGGSATGCDIPNDAVAITVNASATDAEGNGFLRGAAQNGFFILNPDPGTSNTFPNATMLNYTSGFNITSGTTIPICTETSFLFACSGDKELRIRAFLNRTHAVVDVVGYFVPPVFAVVDGDPAGDPNVIRSNGVSSVTHTSLGDWAVNTTKDLRGCVVQVATGNTNEEGTGINILTQLLSVSSTAVFVEQYTANTGAEIDDDWTMVAHC
jgi:hypothetical protein